MNKNLFRTPKININLPTQSKFYPDDFLELSMDDSLPICAMTARDELMLKSPDALLNGDCLLHIMKSCVPSIKNPKLLYSPDVEAILLGIFYASYGKNLDFKSSCTACSHVNDFEIDIREILDRCSYIKDEDTKIELKIDDNTFIIVDIVPWTFETQTQNQLRLFEQSKMMQAVTNDNLDDLEKLKHFNTSFEKIVDIKFKNLCGSIKSISICKRINNEIQKELLKSKEEISDFVFSADLTLVNPVLEALDKLNLAGIEKTFTAKCRNIIITDDNKVPCNHEWSTEISFNPSSFFDNGYNRSVTLK